MSGSRTELEVLDLLCWNSSWKIFSVCVKPFFLRNAVTYPTIFSSSIFDLRSKSLSLSLPRSCTFYKFDSSLGLFLESDLLYGTLPFHSSLFGLSKEPISICMYFFHSFRIFYILGNNLKDFFLSKMYL